MIVPLPFQLWGWEKREGRRGGRRGRREWEGEGVGEIGRDRERKGRREREVEGGRGRGGGGEGGRGREREGEEGRNDTLYMNYLQLTHHSSDCILNMGTQSYTSHETRWCIVLFTAATPSPTDHEYYKNDKH